MGTQGITRRGFVAAAGMAATGVGMMPGVAAARTEVDAPREKGRSEMRLTPYLLFDGKCKEAMEFYQGCLGGQLTMTKVKDSPAKEQMAPFQQERILNAHLSGERLEISASDWLAIGETPVRGNTVCLFLTGGTHEELRAIFDRLSEGAEVTNPLKEMFFGTYGALNDRFGVRWMFQTNERKG